MPVDVPAVVPQSRQLPKLPRLTDMDFGLVCVNQGARIIFTGLASKPPIIVNAGQKALMNFRILILANQRLHGLFTGGDGLRKPPLLRINQAQHTPRIGLPLGIGQGLPEFHSRLSVRLRGFHVSEQAVQFGHLLNQRRRLNTLGMRHLQPFIQVSAPVYPPSLQLRQRVHLHHQTDAQRLGGRLAQRSFNRLEQVFLLRA